MENYSQDFIVDPDLEYDCCIDEKSKGFTPLMRMVTRADIPNILEIITDYLEKNPTEINQQNEKGWTALMMACICSNTKSSNEIIKLLLDKGANVNLQTTDKLSALSMSCMNSGTYSNNSTVELLLSAGANVDVKNNNGDTALILAWCNSNYYSVQLLLKHGANVDAKNNTGNTALMLASEYSRTASNEIIHLLLKSGADINLQNNVGCTALICACGYSNTTSNIETVRLLLEAGADINLKDNNNCTAVMWAFTDSADQNVIKVLLDYNPDLNVVASNRTTVYDQLTNKPELNEFFHKCLRDKLIKDKDLEIKQLEDDIAYYKRCLALHADGAQIIELGDSFLKKPPL